MNVRNRFVKNYMTLYMSLAGSLRRGAGITHTSFPILCSVYLLTDLSTTFLSTFWLWKCYINFTRRYVEQSIADSMSMTCPCCAWDNMFYCVCKWDTRCDNTISNRLFIDVWFYERILFRWQRSPKTLLTDGSLKVFIVDVMISKLK